jgi:hypothetical protein
MYMPRFNAKVQRSKIEWAAAQDMLQAHQRGCRDCQLVGQKIPL